MADRNNGPKTILEEEDKLKKDHDEYLMSSQDPKIRIYPKRSRDQCQDRESLSPYDFTSIKKLKMNEVINYDDDFVNTSSDDGNAEPSESEEERFQSDDDPDEEVLAVAAKLSGQIYNHDKLKHVRKVKRPEQTAHKVFSFGLNFSLKTVWPEASPPTDKRDMSMFIRERSLVKKGQPEFVIESPNLIGYIEANRNINHRDHIRADWFPSYYTLSMVEYATDPYFYIDVGKPPPKDLVIPPLPHGFQDFCLGIPRCLVNPEKNDPIIPLFYKRTDFPILEDE